MAKVCLFVLAVLIVYIHGSSAMSFPSNDPVIQGELDRLIGEALDRDLSQQPNKQEYERYFKVRKFVMDHSKDEAPSTTTTEAPAVNEPTTPYYLNENWWYNKHMKGWNPIKALAEEKAKEEYYQSKF